MSRLHSSELNLGGLAECTIPRRSASRSPARPKVSRQRKKKETEPDPSVMDIGIEQIDLTPTLPLNPLEQYVNSLRDEYVPRVFHNDHLYVLMPSVNEDNGQLIRDIRRLSYSVVEIGQTAKNLSERYCEHENELRRRECFHARAIREGNIVQTKDSPIIDGGITPICDKLKLFVTCPKGALPAVVRAYRTRANCVVCHKDTCIHVRELSGSPHLDFRLEDNDEDEGETVQIKWRTTESTVCDHYQPIHRKKRESIIVDDRGATSKQLVTFEISNCCKHVVFPTSVFCVTDAMLISATLLKFYASLLSKAATTVSGYWRSLVDFGLEMGRSAEDIISLSALSRGWNAYLTQMEIPDHKFGCDQCGQFPSTLVFDGLQLGIRASVAKEKAIPKGNYTFIDYPLPYLGKLQDRKAMLMYLKGDLHASWPDVSWPAPVTILLDEARDDDGKVKEEYREFLLMLFANSPLPLLLQAGVIGARRDLYDKLIDGSLQWKQEELIIQREFPTLYRSLRPLICGNTFPKSVLGTLDYIRSESDYLLVTAPHNESYYGPLIESRLESFPLWPLQRGLTAYRKDSNKEQQLDCAEKVVGENKKLSPGIMLIMCTHRRPYGFRVLKTPESIRDVFQIVLSRLGSNMPQTIIYDNCCHLAAYALAREPARFANVRFLIDRFHHDNHVSCSLSLRLRSYDSDPSMASLNSQSCEQTNALLRKLGNSLPYMALPRYIKTIKLSLSRN